MKKNKIDVYQGHGRIQNATLVQVTANDGSIQNLATKRILLATGSKVRSLPHIVIDGKDIISSDELLQIETLPESLAIIGGGVIGCEFASCFGRFGTKVAIFEIAPQLLPNEDADVAQELAKALKKQNCEVFTNVKVTEVKALGGKAQVMLEGETTPRVFQKVLVAIGRAPVTEDCGLENIGITPMRGGFLEVDLKTYRTKVSGVWAVGDIIPTPQLAHTASAEALVAVDDMLGKTVHPVKYHANPGAIYTYPEIASVGKTEAQLKSEGRAYKVGKFPFSAIGKARIEDALDGFVKILVCPQYGEVLGVHIIHAKATELIAGMCLGINLEMTIEDLARTIHPHPTLSEALMEAAHAAMGHALHI